MSHAAQRSFCSAVRRRCPERFVSPSVLDVGSLDVNGNNRWLFSNTAKYLGIDLVAGKNVDLVVPVGSILDSFDIVISTECLEHDPEWLATLQAMCRRVRPDGMLLLTCAGPTRHEHGTRRFPKTGMAPQDYYQNRTVQDALQAMACVDWSLVEVSYSADRSDLYAFAIRST